MDRGKRTNRTLDLVRRALDQPADQQVRWLIDAADDQGEAVAALELFMAARSELEATEAGPPIDPGPGHGEIAGFRILQQVGVGAFSRVFRAQAPGTEETVALKVLHVGNVTVDALARFRLEAQLLETVDHPQLPAHIDSGVARSGGGTVHWIAMAFIEGRPLDAAVGDLAHEPRSIVKLFVDLGRAVQHAHDLGVIHRDLKPSNVLVDDKGIPHVVDFGAARLRAGSDMSSLTGTGQVVGTLAYMAPEQRAGGPVDQGADQYSLAVMLHEALFGVLPRAQVAALRPWGSPPTRTNTLRDLQGGPLGRVLDRALDPRPKQRFTSVSEFVADLQRWIDGRGIKTSRIGALRRRLVRQVPLAAAGQGLLALAMVGAAALMLGRSMGKEVGATDSVDRHLVRLQEDAASLWPVKPDILPGIERWLVEAKECLDRFQGATGVNANGPLGEQWRALYGPGGTLEDVRRRRVLVASIMSVLETTDGGAWEAARRRVEAAGMIEFAAGFPLQGLLPLGPDPTSGLEEFAFPDGGSVPRRASGSGQLEIADDSCIVLVLIPGGTLAFGAPEAAREATARYLNAPGMILSAAVGNRPVSLNPFLLSKYETTQSQWRKVMGDNPSERRTGEIAGGLVVTDRHPVELVTMEGCLEFAQRTGLQLPTEAQWEWAAAPVDPGLFWWSDPSVPALGLENLLAQERDSTSVDGARALDGYLFHAPVGSFAANPNGLFDILGNVQERCADPFKVDATADESIVMRSGDGLVIADGGGDYSIRGEFFHASATRANLAARYGTPGYLATGHIGVRFAYVARR